ncbi:hypothetical protein [Gloeobacter kilaueensis]|uniref:Ribonuclease E n=1 Tax=Gloeobacter kilaueensis (strain ATCC BAA-2537 / CCAP 1431/1 / ULC 316 / JS1) TaxID=1183438 RepID=U5QK45_GLOK1|nr:hypothetical protein [Gloeobacter kilaueensis]AGY57989.1 ribonuclease E [Gloeobacter kilaueensis JS1]
MYLIVQFCLAGDCLPHLLIAEPIADDSAIAPALQQTLNLLKDSRLIAEPELVLDELPDEIAEFASTALIQRQLRGPWTVYSAQTAAKQMLGKPLAFAYARKLGLFEPLPADVPPKIPASLPAPLPSSPPSEPEPIPAPEEPLPAAPAVAAPDIPAPASTAEPVHPLDAAEYLDDPDEGECSEPETESCDSPATLVSLPDSTLTEEQPVAPSEATQPAQPFEAVFPVSDTQPVEEIPPPEQPDLPAQLPRTVLTGTTEVKFNAADEAYDFERCTVTLTLQLLPDDGNALGRQVVCGVRSHNDPPIIDTLRLSELQLPPVLTSLLEQLAATYPARQIARQRRTVSAAPRSANGKNSQTTSTSPRNRRSKTPTTPPSTRPAAPLPPLSSVPLSAGEATEADKANQLPIF